MTPEAGNQAVPALTFADLARAFPAVFGTDPVKPLKIDITDDIVAALGPAVPVAAVRRCLRIHTRRPDYLKALVAGGHRYDLAGSPCGEINEGARFAANAVLQRPAEMRAVAGQRALFLKAFEASGLSMEEFAKQVRMDARQVNSDLDKARHERGIRHAKQAFLVQRLQESGLTAEEFAAKRRIPIKKLLSVVEKVAARSHSTVSCDRI